MIFVTGDTHGDIFRFKAPVLKKLKKNDTLIICGDFGFFWDGNKKEKKLVKKLMKLRYNVLFVEGSHDNYDLLNEYEVTDWCGGKVRHIGGKVRQLMRGQVYEIAGKKIFAFGGSQNEVDASDRIAGVNWWADEVPKDEQMKEAYKNLEKNDYKVDFMITHEPPALINECIERKVNDDRTTLNSFLDDLREKVEYHRWYFGKLHINKLIPTKYVAIFDGIAVADSTKIKNKTKEIS